jgi:hypothetical protein
VTEAWSHWVREFAGLPGDRLVDPSALAAAAVAAAAGIGLAPHGPPLARSGPEGVDVVLAGHGGHIALHAIPARGACLADVATRQPQAAARAGEILARRLGAL